MGLGGVAIAILPSIICLKLTFSDGLGGNCAVTLREPHSCKAFRRCLSRRLRKAFCVLALTN